jgi:DNA-directed RNA polymerase subunit RPC12/RpoP
MEYTCLLCFHRWDDRMDKVKERQCSRCKSRAVVEYGQFESVVNQMREIIRSSERPIVSISRAVAIMLPLSSRVRPGPLRVMNLWRKVLIEAGVKDDEVDAYLTTGVF